MVWAFKVSLDHDDDEERDRPKFELPPLTRRREVSMVVVIDDAVDEAAPAAAAAAKTMVLAERNRRQQEIKSLLPEGVRLAKHSVSIRSAYARSGPSAPVRRKTTTTEDEDVEDETDDEQNYTEDMLQLAD